MISQSLTGGDDPPAIELRGVTVRFGGITALNDVNLAVRRGEFCGLIGANGAGKTTLFDVISGLRRPDGGRVELQGVDVTRWRPHRRARAGLRRTFQRVQTFGWLTVVENLLVATEWRGGGGGVWADLVAAPTRSARTAGRLERAEAVLEMCGLQELRDRSAGSLPIGTGRLVELARALMDEPAALLLDEPASGLDTNERNRFGDLVERIVNDQHTAVLLVEHDVGFVMDRCERVVVLHLGEILADGSPESVRANPLVLEAYLGSRMSRDRT